ncbi:hypothetical protein SB4_18220 [Sphingomonas sanguinis]|uniref:Uncharacterized protein n=1 Tax=Sphingomonas sanguinis TaxID=33051 RepID=A0A147IJD4_9SPHN|nr:hypothetical protein SB4_18220 [Sphingomonas sanguinis]
MVIAAGALVAAVAPTSKFGTIDVERINVREPDGTLRLVIAGRDRFPGEFLKGQEKPRPDRRHAAGMLFLNDEGTENGGLIWAGKKDASGVHAGASLTFDRYEQDQTLQLLQTDSGNRHNAALIINDQPSSQPEYKAKEPDGKAMQTATRLFVGRSQDGAAIILQDAKGTPRIFLRVKDDGTSAIDFLDQNGKVVRSLTPDG